MDSSRYFDGIEVTFSMLSRWKTQQRTVTAMAPTLATKVMKGQSLVRFQPVVSFDQQRVFLASGDYRIGECSFEVS